MRWLAATLALLSASAAVVLGIYLRDRGSAWRPPQRIAADFDARTVLNYVAGPTCGKRCSYELLAHPRTNHWLARVVDRSRAECVDIDLMKFATTATRGILGIEVIDCPSVPAAAGA